MSDKTEQKLITLNELKPINSQLAASAQQSVRDQGLQRLTDLLVTEKYWVSQPEDKYLRVIWEGLFFMFWHADKSKYQQETSLKIASIMAKIQGQDEDETRSRKKAWFNASLQIMNKHWHKVDNFRIDKFLSLLRHLFSEALTFLKAGGYQCEDLKWFDGLMLETLTEKRSSQGIALQICDVFIPELGKVDSEQISLDQLSEVLKPFLLALGQSTSKIVQNRIKETIFNPLLESNVTLPDSEDESSDGEENLAQVDGGKLSRRTRKQVMALINQKYVFPNFNILHYAENHIFPLASAPSEQVNEANRELIYLEIKFKFKKLLDFV